MYYICVKIKKLNIYSQCRIEMSEFSVYPIIVNASNVVSGSNNSTYRYNFPGGAVNFKGAKIAVAQISMFNSVFNITAANGNNTFSFLWYSGITTQFDITITDGYYDIAALNSYLQQYCITNSLYLIDAAGDYVYYLEFIENPNAYAVQFNSYPIPTALPVGYSAPAGWLGYPLTTLVPRLIVPSTNFQNLIGFVAGTFPTAIQTTAYSANSSFTPQVSPVESMLLSCSLLNNIYSNPNTILYSFTAANTEFGNLIDSRPAEFAYVNVQDGSYPYFELRFLDQSYNALTIQDSNLIVQLLIRNVENNY
jgi:hypothetical protein